MRPSDAYATIGFHGPSEARGGVIARPAPARIVNTVRGTVGAYKDYF